MVLAVVYAATTWLLLKIAFLPCEPCYAYGYCHKYRRLE